jgi:hypothetical protein
MTERVELAEPVLDSAMSYRVTAAVSAPERAGHALRVRAAALAESVVAELYRRRPDLETRYGPAGRRHCVNDLAHHVRFLATSIEMGDAKVFVDYVAWAADVMASRGVDVRDQLDSLEVLRDVAAAAVPEDVADFVRDTVSAAFERAKCASTCPRPRARRLSPAQLRPDARPAASTAGSTPAHS